MVEFEDEFVEVVELEDVAGAVELVDVAEVVEFEEVSSGASFSAILVLLRG